MKEVAGRFAATDVALIEDCDPIDLAVLMVGFERSDIAKATVSWLGDRVKLEVDVKDSEWEPYYLFTVREIREAMGYPETEQERLAVHGMQVVTSRVLALEPWQERLINETYTYTYTRTPAGQWAIRARPARRRY